MSVERQWRTTGSLGAKPYPPLEQSATALDQLRLVIQKLEIRDSIQLLNWKTLPEIPRQQCISVRTDCIFMYYILYNDNYNKYIYILFACSNTSIICKFCSQHGESSNDQPQNVGCLALLSARHGSWVCTCWEHEHLSTRSIFSATWWRSSAQKKVVFEKHVPWSTCNGLIRFMVIHPIIGILVLGVCVWGGI